MRQGLFYITTIFMTGTKHTLQSSPSTGLTYLAFANISIIWGSTFLAIVYALRGFPPFLLSGLRFFVAGMLLLSWRLAVGEKMPAWRDWGKNAIAGALILGGGTGLIAWAEQYVSSSEAAIVSATAPFWFMAMDTKNRKAYLADKLSVLGLLIGFGGLLLFVGNSLGSAHIGNGTQRITAFVLLALSSVSWVIGSLYAKNNPPSGSTVSNTAQQLVAGGGISLLAGVVMGEGRSFSPAQVPAEAWVGLAFLIVMGSIVAYLSYVWLLGTASPVLVSTHTYINPVVAVTIGWLFLGETVSVLQLAGLGIILAGVLLTNLSGYRIQTRAKVWWRQTVRRDFTVEWPRLFSRYRTS